jgi:hypothetical protein
MFHIIYTDSVHTTQEAYYTSAKKTNRLMLFREKITLYCENHTKKHKYTVGRPQFQYVKVGGTYSNRGACDSTVG